MTKKEELEAVLTAIFCINQTGNKDKDISKLCEYALKRLSDVNYNIVLLCTIGISKDDIMPYVNSMLDTQTHFKKFLEENK
jgi:hypothetical protein